MNALVAGIDVGGPRKGFHVVLLRRSKFVAKLNSTDANETATWCRSLGVQVIGIDAPCRWRTTGDARPAERSLMAEGISCFATPSEQTARGHSGSFYRWMLAGAALYSELALSHALFTGRCRPMRSNVCLETFPQAIACALAGRIVSAKDKCTDRRDILQQAGVPLDDLANMDEVDAALCALAADHVARGTFRSYGDDASGHILVPARVSNV